MLLSEQFECVRAIYYASFDIHKQVKSKFREKNQ